MSNMITVRKWIENGAGSFDYEAGWIDVEGVSTIFECSGRVYAGAKHITMKTGDEFYVTINMKEYLELSKRDE